MTRVSVNLAVRDVAPWLAEAVDSVLAQVGPDDEVVVVDDGSTDATPQVLAGYGDRLRVLRQGPLGLTTARNAGIAASRGALLAFLDGDDRWAPGSLATLVAALAEAPTADAVLGRTDEFLDPALGGDPAAAGLRAPQQGVQAFFLGALLARRELFDRVPFADGAVLATSTEWVARARHAGVVIEPVDAVVLERRLRQGSMTTDVAGYQRSLLDTLRQDLARRRSS